MKKSAIILFLTCLFVTTQAQETIKIGGWRIHLPYNSVEQLVETPQLIYARAELGIYSFNKVSGEIELYSKVNGLSETEVSAIAYSEDYNTLIIGYKNTNIDLIKNGKIINLPGILRKSIVGKKEINEIRVFGSKAYICASFGIVVIDLDREEIFDSYLNIGPGGTTLEIFSLSEFSGHVYVGTPDGIYRAPLTGLNLSDFNSWSMHLQDSQGISLLRPFNSLLYFVQKSELKNYDGSMYTDVDPGVKPGYRSIELDHNKLTVCKDSGITIYDQSGVYRQVNERYKFAAVYDHEDNIWAGGFYSGLIKITPSNQYSFLRPQGPFGPTSFAMEAMNDQVWVTSGGRATNYSPTFTNFGFYYFEEGNWTNRDLGVPELSSMFDFTAIAVDPESNDVWLGSFGTGIAHLRNGQFIEKFDYTNSALQEYVNGWTMCLGMAFDHNKDLWITNFEGKDALVVRRSSGAWESFDVGNERLGRIIIDDFGTKWILVERSSTPGAPRGMIAFRKEESGSVFIRKLSEGEGLGGLPNSTVNVAVLDKDGEIWIGTETGLAVFYNPSLVFEGGVNADAQQLIIDDGQDIGFLLGNEVVNDIKIDGANRKWVATNNGAWLIAADGSAVIEHFTTSNSPLPSNEVNCLAINPNSGEVFFGTIGGIISYRSDATEAGDFHQNTLVYPNPVHKGYEGPITITGLPENATVKIADVAGRVVYELIATGGTAVWHGRNFAGELPKSGVYLIFTANKEDEDALVTKLLIVR